MAGEWSRTMVSVGVPPRGRTTDHDLENPNGEIDENFWAQAAADRAELGEEEMGMSPHFPAKPQRKTSQTPLLSYKHTNANENNAFHVSTT